MYAAFTGVHFVGRAVNVEGFSGMRLFRLLLLAGLVGLSQGRPQPADPLQLEVDEFEAALEG